eukprot:g9632.t1
MADMSAIRALQKAERLVSTIARAFYTDNTILVVDTLIREKYIKDKDEELGSRLNLQPKQVRSALAELLAEGFAAKEMMSDEIYSGRSSNYWYIDLRHAVNVILLRVYQMKEILSHREEANAAHQTYVCPKCHARFEVMDIPRLMNGDSSFCCSHCCPNDNHRDCKRGTGYILEDFHDKKGLDSVKILIKQLNEQLGKSTNPDVPRESIFELVHSLRDTVVPSNLPSQLRQRGMGGQHRGDVSSAHARFQDDFHHRGRAAEKAAAERGAASRRNSSRPVQVLVTKNWRGEEVVVEIEQSEEEDDDDDDDDDWDGEGGGGGGAGGALVPSRAALKRKVADAAAKEEEAAKRAKKALPTFLKGSAISGAGDGNSGDGSDDDDAESSSSNGDGGANAVAAAAAHARRLGVATVTNLAERDEMKKRLLPWTKRMKQILRRQQSETRQEREANGGGGGGNGRATANGDANGVSSGDDAWWENADDDGDDDERLGTGGIGSHKRPPAAVGLLGLAGVGAGERFRVGVRIVPIEALTVEDVDKMSTEEYTRFYNVVVGE